MLVSQELQELLKKELKFKTSRSGGKGGQNVNKVESRVELLFDVDASFVLNETQKQLIILKNGNRINEDGVLKLTEDKHRSQLQNKDDVTERFFDLISRSLVIAKKRKATRPSKASKIKRGEAKKKRSEVKNLRKKLY